MFNSPIDFHDYKNDTNYNENNNKKNSHWALSERYISRREIGDKCKFKFGWMNYTT